MKPAHLIPGLLVLSVLAIPRGAAAQSNAGSDAEPAATAPAPPPAPLAPAGPPELPPPPPPRGAPPPPQGKMVLSAPPVPPAMQRAGYHVHDGFYLRVGAGFGGGHAAISGDSTPNFGQGGPGVAFNLWIGGTPWRGVALGGLFSLQTVRDSDAVVEGSGTGLGLNGRTVLIGSFIDAFPDPLRGLHIGGSLGVASLRAAADSHELERLGVANYDGVGLGASTWIGYMGWVGPEASLGGMLQLTGFGTGEKDNGLDRRGSGYTVSVSFTALYH